jgi:Zn-dependent protease
MKLSGFTLFHIAGIEIVIDYSWLVIFFMAMYTTQEIGSLVFHQQYPSHQYWIMGAVTAVLFFFSVLLHELAHSLVAIRNGIRITSVRLLLFGGLSQATSEPKNGRQEFLIALAGPATSMAAGMFFLIVWAFSAAGIPSQVTPTSLIASLVGSANILVAFFNLIPGFPLDGGRILRAILWDHWNDMSRATKVVSQLGNAVAIFLILFGFLMFVLTQSILAGLWIVFMGLFMKQSAVGSYHGVMLKRALGGVQVQQIMTENLVTVDWLLSIEELVQNYIYRHQFTNFPVFNRDEFIGMVSLDGVKSISKDLWGFKQVRDIMTPIEFVPCLKPTDDASEVLSRMVSADAGPMPVVEGGRLMGIVSRRDIMNFFKIKSDLGAA